jgi:hypothetical protein
MNNAFEPWVNAAKAWTAESEKFQRAAFDNLAKAMDNSHKMAKESLDLVATMTTNMQKQVTAQVERATEMMTSFIP